MSIFDRILRGTITCSNCGRRFKQNVEDRPWAGGGVMRLFQCSRCGQEYPVARISARGVELMAAIQDLDTREPSFRKRLKKFQRELKGEVTRP